MEKVWLKHYDKTMQSEINVDSLSTLLEIFESSVAEYANQTAFINMGHEITFEDLDVLSMQFAAYLQSQGLQKGDAIAIMMPNLLQYPIALFGVLRAGMTVVNVNPLYTARELQHQLMDANVKTIVIVENFAHTLAEVINNTSVKEVLLTSIADMLPAPKRWLVNFAVKYIKKMVPEFNLPQAKRFSQAMAIGENQTYSRPKVLPS
ncbi:MAG: long-chain acyl-CoA synthetase, partial [Glaciecola sp.]